VGVAVCPVINMKRVFLLLSILSALETNQYHYSPLSRVFIYRLDTQSERPLHCLARECICITHTHTQKKHESGCKRFQRRVTVLTVL
jgi:hypothetical protein